jgi:beta-glucanase (GH16 family)
LFSLAIALSVPGLFAAETSAASAPKILAKSLPSGAQVVSISTITKGAILYYTLDNKEPDASSLRYQAPFLVSATTTVKALAIKGETKSPVAQQNYSVQIASGKLIWSDEFTNKTSKSQAPDPAIWTYDVGGNGFGNHELENYCAHGSSKPPCLASEPNSYVGADGYLHIVARKDAAGRYTSARLKSQGLFSVRYGRIEARIKVPSGAGFWPAFWMLGSDIPVSDWPACGELDIMETVGLSPNWIAGSIHGRGFVGGNLSTRYSMKTGSFSDDFHVFGMTWSPGKIEYYLDDPARVYATYTPDDIAKFPGAVWPFDSQDNQFLLLNLAVGGDWPGAPNAETRFPSEMLVDYVRIYAL